MGDYFLAQQLIARLGLTRQQLEKAEQAGYVQPVQKHGYVFYSAHQAYKLQAVRKLMEKKGYTWEQALAETIHRPLYQVSKG
ncbi:MAG: MerR family transcriptional regulator [Terriglobia bacterium]